MPSVANRFPGLAERTISGPRRRRPGLVPGQSNAEAGLRYRLYKNRYAELAGRLLTEVESLMPLRHDEWVYGPADAGPDWEGYEGFISERHEVDRLAGALRRNARPT